MKQSLIHKKGFILIVTIIITALCTIQINWLAKAYQFKQDSLERKLDDLVERIAINLDVDTTFFDKDIISKKQIPNISTIEQRINSFFLEEHINEDIYFALFQTDTSGVYYSNTSNFEDELRSSPYKACLSCITTIRFIDDTLKAQTPEMTFLRAESEYERLPGSPPRSEFLYLGVFIPNQLSSIIKQLVLFGSATVILASILLWTFQKSIKTIILQEKTNQVQKNFFTNMTHEFKTPLGTIGLAARMLSGMEIDKRKQDYLQLIQNESSKLENQVDKILHFSPTLSDEMSYEKEVIDIIPLIESSLKRLSLFIDQQHAVIKIEFPETPILLEIDKSHFSNCIYNLIENALKYSPKHSTIQLQIEVKDQGISIQIQDNGPGIPSSHQDKIFDRFYRAQENDKYQGKGFGIGLAYVKSVLEAHEGDVHLDKTYTDGARFIIELPLNKNLE